MLKKSVKYFSTLFIIIFFSSCATVDLPKPPPLKESSITEAEKASSLAYYHFSRAQLFENEEKIDSAIEEYKLALNYDMDSPVLRIYLAIIYIKKGLLQDAIHQCQSVISSHPEHSPARLLLGGLYSSTGNEHAAINEY